MSGGGAGARAGGGSMLGREGLGVRVESKGASLVNYSIK